MNTDVFQTQSVSDNFMNDLTTGRSENLTNEI